MKRIYNLWTKKEIEYLKNNYDSKNKEDIINNINHSWGSVQVKASKLNLTEISINEDFFKNWTKEMAYIFGFWIADGNMGKNNNKISFASKDYDLISMIKHILKSDHKLYEDKNNVFHLSFNNKIIYDDLIKLGGIPIKSLIIQFPEIPEEYLSHFIRGEFDGDGCNYIYKDKRGTSNNKYLISNFIGNVDFLSTLKDKIKEHAGIETGKLYWNKRCNSRIKELRYRGKNAIALGDYMFKDSENLRLERKFKIYNKMKKEHIKKLEMKQKNRRYNV